MVQQCKGPEAEVHLGSLGHSKEASVARAEGEWYREVREKVKEVRGRSYGAPE
jgi:hypothetical protein